MIERHEEWSDLAPMYVLGGLEAEEVEAFEAHMATCEACRQEVKELQEVTGFRHARRSPLPRRRVCGHVCWATCSAARRRAPRRSRRLLWSLKHPRCFRQPLRRSTQMRAARPGLPPNTAVPAARQKRLHRHSRGSRARVHAAAAPGVQRAQALLRRRWCSASRCAAAEPNRCTHAAGGRLNSCTGAARTGAGAE